MGPFLVVAGFIILIMAKKKVRVSFIKNTSSGAEKKSPSHKMCGIQIGGVNFLKLFIKKFAHLCLVLAHFVFRRLACNVYCSKTLQCNFMKFSVLAEEV